MIALIMAYCAAYIAIGVISFAFLWVMFAAVMRLQESRDTGKLTGTTLKLGTVLLYFGMAFDIFCNVFFATLIFAHPPMEATVSARLRKMVLWQDGWQKSLAVWFAVNLLNPVSYNGDHIPLTKPTQ